MRLFAVLVGLAAAGAGGLRWLRVAQREHYLPGSVSRFALRWWQLGANRLLAVAGVLGVVLSTGSPLAGVVGSLAVATGPFGLSVLGRTAPLAWTRRMRTLAGVWAGLQLLLVLVGWVVGLPVPFAVLGALLVPVLVDAALAVTKPIEDRLAQPYVHQASIRLKQVRPTVVAVTGSYGKTTTKGYIAHLVAGTKAVVPTPRSFNNRAGLARAINEHLALGTEVFVAEMGTYGKGEIAELCRFVPPSIAVITAIGPVHLERMKTEEGIVEAKSEILEGASVAVLNVDHPLLAALADKVEATGKRVVRCRAADAPANPPEGAHPSNVACAVAVALELGVPADVVESRVAGLPVAEHRLTASTGSGGFTIVDDTYNANPAGTTAALAALARHAQPGHKQVVVTPGMVELGPRQAEENQRFAAAAVAQATHFVVVGHTNRAALLEGARGGQAEVLVVETREDAVAWVRENLQPGDAVLYENDLPDHFP
ncbi:MAG TPA: UDP-N-acetylmuramoyl-tripeptide--D-alanyl-D-alanine ligase [Acidimicrobiales bacterium]|nr:UDP-N-acetylmuramoyl-tripeptide--D-alanyl-D-alanine ligase [Acidimicrobiales bacterium]